MAAAGTRWMTATKRLWPGSHAVTSGHSKCSRAAICRPCSDLLAACSATPPTPRMWPRSHVAGLDPCAALAAAGRVPYLAHAHYGQSLPRPQAARALGRAGSGRRTRRPSAGATEQAEHDERERLVARAIAELPDRQRAAIVLTYTEGMSNAQVADILDTSVSAVETLLVRGKQNLRRALKNVIEGIE